jgi:DNA-binding response OmpR family regulator
MPKAMNQERPHHGHTLYEAYLATKPVRVLLAEDDPEMRKLVAASLTREGYEVCAVSDGGRLLALIGSQILDPVGHPPADIVISDVRMPVRSGLEVLAGLRRCDWAVPFILITAFGDQETHAEAKRLGAAAVFDKPFELADLKTCVINLVVPR